MLAILVKTIVNTNNDTFVPMFLHSATFIFFRGHLLIMMTVVDKMAKSP